MTFEQDRRITEVVERVQSGLRNFIRRRVPDPRDAEDILQDVFYELVEANRLLMPIDHVTGWLFRVALNRITDLFRKKMPERFRSPVVTDEDEGRLRMEDLLPAPARAPAERLRRVYERVREPTMNRKKLIYIAPLAIFGLLAFMAIGGWIVQLLWNWLLPALFGWPQIGLWQALGLLALCRILFGGVGAHGPRSNIRRRIAQRMDDITPEERERFREGLRRHFGFGSSADEGKQQ